jgi:hypothetical protein
MHALLATTGRGEVDVARAWLDGEDDARAALGTSGNGTSVLREKTSVADA